jgi:hypothetical protein
MKTFDASDERDVEHFACGISGVVDMFMERSTHVVATDEDFEMQRVLSILERISLLSKNETEMIHSTTLVRNISRRIRGMTLYETSLLRILRNAKFYDVRMVDDMLQRSIAVLSNSSSCIGNLRDEYRDFVEMCFIHNPRCRDNVVHDMVELWRTGWRMDLGALLSHYLDTASVEFVVCLEKKKKLCFLIRESMNHTTISWRHVRSHLRRHWPERVNDVLQTGCVDDEPLTTAECPITNVGMRHPVVASDGHTYERDSIIRHMLHNGPWSPMTRGIISYYLYTNRAIMTTQ